MKNFNNYKVMDLIKSKALIMVSSSMLLTSCIIQTGGYSETDGVYYDPNRDTVPQGYAGNTGNQVDQYYNYSDDDMSLYERSQKNQQMSDGRYGSYESDWGDYTGTQTYYSSNYNNFGWGGYSVWGSPYYPSRWGMSMGFGWNPWGMSNWGWNNYFDPYWGWSYGNYWGNNYYPSYYGYGGNYYGNNYYRPDYRRSSSNGSRLDGMLRENSVRNQSNGFRNNNGGFRADNSGVRSGNNGGFRNPDNSGVRTGNNGGFRNPGTNSGNVRTDNGGFRNTTPRSYESQAPVRSNPAPQNNGGFRSGSSGGFGGSSSGGGGGFRSGGGSSGGGGGFRSGGGR